MKRAHLACVTSALLGFPALLGGCDTNPLVVVENDGGDKGSTGDSGKANDEDSGKGTDEDSGKGNDEDSGGKNGNDANAGVCLASGLTFDLAIGTNENVWLGGSTPPWPAPSFGCPGWLTIAPQAGTSLGNLEGGSVILAKNACGILCPAAQPQPAASQSFTWDGTYYPVTGNVDCGTPACAPAGNYLATMCVGYAGED